MKLTTIHEFAAALCCLALSLSAQRFESVDGAVVGTGPDYRVRLGADGIEFATRPAADGPALHPLRLRLLGVHRGQRMRPLPQPELVVSERTVEYRRPGLIERYELRPEGVEQSFVLAHLPPGDGDLVVALATDTRLEPERDSDRADGGGLWWRPAATAAGAPVGVHIGGVTVLDARGASTRGELRQQAGRLELVAPASFVRDAALPLIVDPLIGNRLSIHGVLTDAVGVAYDATQRVFVVVWLTNGVLIAQRLRSDGAPIGSRRAISTNCTGLAGVATVQRRSSFLIAYNRPTGVTVRAIQAFGAGSVSPEVLLPNTIGAPVIAISSAAVGEERAPIVWRQQPGITDHFTAAYVTVAAGNNVSFGPPTLLTGTRNDFSAGAISRIAGATEGRRLFVFVQGGIVRGLVLDNALVPVGAQFQISGADGHLRSQPTVDGDGTSWIVAYARREFLGASPSDVMCRRVAFNPTTRQASFDGPEVFVAQTPNADDFPGQIARVGTSFLLALVENGAPKLYSLDPTTCGPCEGGFALGGSGCTALAVATPETAGFSSTGRESLVAWELPTSGVLAHLYVDRDGAAVGSNGRCGQGGTAIASCPRVGNAGFSIRLQGAASAAPAVLMLGVSRINLGCGPCTLVPDAFVTLAAHTSSLGTASIAIPLRNDPSLGGLSLYCQWAIVRQGGDCIRNLDFSTSPNVTIER